MKYLLLAIIRIYWKLKARSGRQRCIFRTSCSRHVYEQTKEKGLYKGVTELIFRMQNCNGHYLIYRDTSGEVKMRLRTGAVINECEIAGRLTACGKP
jgi:putative component of membrane protein insertase Oxa1/YidC/SpoIIIJ protein YidD